TWTDDNPAMVRHEVWARSLSRKLVLASTDGLIVLSDATAQMYRNDYGALCPIAVSPLVQDERVFRDRLRGLDYESRELVNEYRLVGKRVLLFVGRLATEKRVDRLITAYAAVRHDFPDSVLVLVGDGP